MAPAAMTAMIAAVPNSASAAVIAAEPEWLLSLQGTLGGDAFGLAKTTVLTVLLFVAGWIVARLSAWLVFKALTNTKLDDQIAAKLGFDLEVDAQGKPREKHALERKLSRGCFWIFMLLVIVSAMEFAGLTQAAGPIRTLVDTVSGALPYLGKAAIIMGAAYIFALALSKIVTRALDKLNIDARLTIEDEKGEKTEQPPMAETAGSIIFWLILTFGLAGALDALGIEPVSGPLHNALDQIVTTLPLVAISGFLIVGGWFLGKFARTVVRNLLAAVGLDRIAAKIGVDKLLGKSTASNAVGVGVMAFIVLQAVIAALNKLGLETLADPLTAMMAQFWGMLPSLFVAVLLVTLAVVFARLARRFVTQALKQLGFDGLLAKLGLGRITSRPELSEPSEIVGLVVQVLIVTVAMAQALAKLGLDTWADYVELGIAFTLEHVLVALAIIAVGMAIGTWVAELVRGRMNTEAGEINPASEFARYAVIVFSFTMALNQLAVAQDIVFIAFALLFGALCLAAALAFGLGGRDLAGEVLRRRYQQARTSSISSSPKPASPPSAPMTSPGPGSAR